jgi:hypothetical protein
MEMNKNISDFLDEANPRDLLEAYFDAKTQQKGLISTLPIDIVEACVASLTQALDLLPVYGKDNKVVTREQFFEARKKLKESGFKF